MLVNYLKIAIRQLFRNKVFSTINIVGMAIGLACCLIITLFIVNELQYDQFHTKRDRIFRLISTFKDPSASTLAVTPAPWAPLIASEFPAVESTVRMLKDTRTLVGLDGDQRFYEQNVFFSDPAFFSVFDFPLTQGNAGKALTETNTAVLTKSMAEKYFRNEDPIGKTLQITSSFGNELPIVITGVTNDPPGESHFHFSILISMATLGDISNFWSYHMFQSYVLLREGQHPSDLEKLFPAFAGKYIDRNSQADGAVNIFLQPLTAIHLHSNLVGEVETNGSITYVYILSGIALCILVLACFNFVNLSTVHSLSRAKEIGLRKSVGAQPGQLIRQFLGEAVLVTLLSSLAAVVVAWGVLPVVNVLFHKNLLLLTFADPVSIIIAVAFILLIGIATGIYPSLVLTSFKPTEVLKGKFAKTIGGNVTRKSLVIFQFASAIVLVACTLTLYQQLDFVKNKDLGFDKSQSVILTLPRGIEASRIEEFKKMLMNNASVMSAAAASSVPSSNLPMNLVRQEGSVNNESHSFEMIFADLDFVKTAGMKVVAGRDFSPDFTTDPEEAFIINEEAVKELGWTPQESVGKKFEWVLPTSVIKSGHIIGVIANVNFRPLNFKVQPMVIHHGSARFQYLYVNVQPGNTAAQVQMLEAEFKKAFPAQPFEFTFFDQTIQRLYDHERTLGSIFIYSSGLAIVIAVLGIFALAMHAASERVKEIGIRKVLGATNGQILMLSVRGFVMLIALANLVALPLAFYLMNRWLASYAYRVVVDWKVLITSGLLIFFVALIAVSVQSIQSAWANPVKSLRSE